MKKTIVLSFLLFGFVSISEAEMAKTTKDCPKEYGEKYNACKKEQKEVNKAIQGLSVYRQHSYCRIPEPNARVGVGLQCRTLTLYKDASGQVSHDYFKLQFIAAETHRSIFWDSHYVKQSNGKYNAYHDELADGKLEIDRHLESWQNTEVTFDDDHFPTYVSVFIVAGTGETSLDKIIYTPYYVDLIINFNLPVEQQETWRYQNTGPYQLPRED